MDRRHEQGDEDGDNRDNNEQFDECERFSHDMIPGTGLD
jgi:hypothetical protein